MVVCRFRGALAVAGLGFAGVGLCDEPGQMMDAVSVTATREARATAEVPQAIAVVGKEDLQEKKMFNVKEALQGIPGVLIDSKNGGFDARLIIRGAGLKAPYGVREIMVLRDGVPLSDPDSFTRLDFVDTQDIERIEVAKGPGNLFAVGSTGGAIQIFSKSVFDERANVARIGLGDQGTQNYHLRYGRVGQEQAVSLTATHRNQENGWRSWNNFDTTQLSLKHGLQLEQGTWESEASYSAANAQLPGVMDNTAANGYMWERFLATGEQDGTSEAWKHSGRYSKVWFLNTRLELERGDFTFKPRLYYNTWYHYHPVTGIINETQDWVWNLGGDLEAQWRHGSGTLVGGITLREERTPDSRKYQYRDVTTGFGGRIRATRSDSKGRLASIEDSTNKLAGLFLQESWQPGPRWIVDAGMRYDRASMDTTTSEMWKYDYAAGKYVAGAGVTRTRKSFNLPAPKLAVSYKLDDRFHLFAMAARAMQIPSSSEFSANPALEAPIARNYEVGLKGRGQGWQMDASIYLNPVDKEIVTISAGGVNQYVNAGKTRKKGLELTGSLALSGGWELGGHYGYADYKYEEFSEPVGGVNQDRAGKSLPFIPRHQYGVFVGWKPGNGWRVRLGSNSWGKYWLDNANTEKYSGWQWVSNLSVAYDTGPHTFAFNADNLFDKLYATEVKKDTTGKVTYSAAAPRTVLATYSYRF